MSINNQKSISDQSLFYLNNLYINYQKEYSNKSTFHSSDLEAFNNISYLSYPLSINFFDKDKVINFFELPIQLASFDLSIYKKFLNKLILLCKKNKINKIYFKKHIFENSIEKLKNQKNKIIKFIGIESTICLKQELNNIFKNFSKGHKSALKKEYKELNYKIIDYQNYKDGQIFEMYNMHKIISGKETRSLETWKINELMIKNNNGFLIQVLEKSIPISYSFFFHDKNIGLYFSACTIREKFKLYKNISHRTIWKSIEYLKKKGCKKLFMGTVKTLYSEHAFDQKKKNIEIFKSSFGGSRSFFAEYFLKI